MLPDVWKLEDSLYVRLFLSWFPSLRRLRGKALQYISPDSVADMNFYKVKDDENSCMELSQRELPGGHS